MRPTCLNSLAEVSELHRVLWTQARAARPSSGPGGPEGFGTGPQVPKNSSSSGLPAQLGILGDAAQNLVEQGPPLPDVTLPNKQDLPGEWGQAGYSSTTAKSFW